MGAKVMLTQYAIDVANQLVHSAQQLKPELRELEERKAQIEATLHSATLAAQRSRQFFATLGDDFQCPRCWVASEARAALTPAPGPSDADVLRS